MEPQEKIDALEKALLEYAKLYGFIDAARDYFIQSSPALLNEKQQMN